MKVLIEREKRKTISLKVVSEDILLVKAPIGLSTQKIDSIIREKRDWISKKQNAMIEMHYKNSSLYDYTQVLVDGELFEVGVGSSQKTNQIDFDNKVLYISKKEFTIYDKKKKACQKLIFNYAKQTLSQLVSVIGTRLSLCPSAIEIKHIRGKSVWGKCGGDRKVTLDYRIVQLPKDLQVYIIIHEFCHLIHLNHSKEFYKTLAYYLSDYKKLAKKLSEYYFLREI